MYPTIPYDLLCNDELMKSVDLESVWRDVCEELTDPPYRNRSHHNPKTYNVGCRGPLCRKAIRDYMRRDRVNSSTQSRYALVNPLLMFYMKEALAQIAAHEAQVLEKLIS